MKYILGYRLSNVGHFIETGMSYVLMQFLPYVVCHGVPINGQYRVLLYHFKCTAIKNAGNGSSNSSFLVQ